MFFFRKNKKSVIYAPCNGIYIPLEQVNDEVFSKGLMGKGFAIRPSTNHIFSPVDGKVTMVFPTKHALGITDHNGIEYILHIGIDTVQLKGNGFSVLVSEGDLVNAGDALVECDFDLIQQEGFETDVMVIVANHTDVRYNCAEIVKAKDEIAYCENV